MILRDAFGREARVNALLGAGHFLSHFYQLCLPPLFIAWQKTFDVSFAELGLAMAVMSAPPATAILALGLGWRSALLLVGLLGLPVVATILWQSRILVDQAREPRRRAVGTASGAALLLSRSVLMFFAFFMISAMAGAGIS